MKHILPILTAALALMASTASAIEYYYPEYYSNTNYDVKPTTVSGPGYWTPGQTVPRQQQVLDYGDYQIVRTTADWGNFSGDPNNRYKIRVTGENVDLYLADWLDTASGKDQTDAVINKKVTAYGYHFVDGKTHVDANGVQYDREIWEMQDAVNDPERFVVFETYKANDGDTIRHGYYLGNFSAGDEIEIYMRDASGEIYSDSGSAVAYGQARYFVDNYDQVVAARLGYTDADKAIAKKTMPLAELAPTNGHSVFFGIYAGAPESFLTIVSDGGPVGSPLPGGLPIALCAGVFALGFWYVRRRKAIAA